MKKYILIAVFAMTGITSYVIYNIVFSEYATCSGGSNCKACKNCKYCKNCAKNGGTCSVCK